MSASVGDKEELCIVLSGKERRTKTRRGAAAGTGMHWGVFGEVTGASKSLCWLRVIMQMLLLLEGWGPPGSQSSRHPASSRAFTSLNFLVMLLSSVCSLVQENMCLVDEKEPKSVRFFCVFIAENLSVTFV